MITCYENGCVFTAAGSNSFAECFVVEDDRFVFVGTTEEAHMRYPHARRIDLNDQFVCPGFNDSHMHLLSTGCMLAQAQLAPHTDSLFDMLDALRAFAQAHPQEAWILGRGWNQDHFADECRYPTRDDLDAVCPDRPCLITRACGHVAIANSKALGLAGISEAAIQVAGGKIGVDSEGRPTGVLEENAINLITACMPQPDRTWIRQRLIDAMHYANSFGVTSAHSDDFSALDIPFEEVLTVYRELKDEEKMTVRVCEQCLLPTLEALDDFLRKGYLTGQGDEWLRIGPLKLLSDGSLGARTALLRAPYADAPSTCGVAIYPPEELNDLVLKAHQAGMQIAIHAIGDEAADRVLHALDRAQQAHPRKDARHGIVHAQVFTKEQISRAKALGIHAYIQPIFLDYDTQIVHDRLGSRAQDAYPAASLLQAGVTFSSGSDSPVEPPDVLTGIQCAVTRKSVSRSMEMPYLPSESLSVHQALQAYTSSSAYPSFEENQKGQISAGMLADFTILGSSPLDACPDQIHQIPVSAVYVGGKQVI